MSVTTFPIPTTATELPRRSATVAAFTHVARLIRRLASVAGWVVVIVGAAVLLVPSFLGYDRYVIVGGSMSGSIERGSVAFAQPVPVEQLAVGDVITYVPPPSTGVTNLVTHRIAKIEQGPAGERLFTTKGDANDRVDPWTFELHAAEQNRVRFDVPLIGHVLVALMDRTIRMIVIGLPAAYVAVRALFDLLFPDGIRRAERAAA